MSGLQVPVLPPFLLRKHRCFGSIYTLKSVMTAVPGAVSPFIARNSSEAIRRSIVRVTKGDRSTRPDSIMSNRVGYFHEGMPRLP